MAYILQRRIIHRGEAQTRTTEVSSDLLRIGRGTSNDLHLDDLAISLNHATLEWSQGRYLLRDLTGAAATYVNHSPIREAVVRGGDTIRIGSYLLRLAGGGTGSSLTIAIEEGPGAKEQDRVALLPQYQLSSGRWTKRALSVALVLLVVGGAAVAFGIGKHRAFMPGLVSLKHSQFADQCINCHAPWKAVWTSVPDKTCQACHTGPTHFGEHSQVPGPQCASCHVEHKEKPALAAVPDSDCYQCHGDLKVKEGRIAFHPQIHGFNRDHPEFAVSVRSSDPQRPTRVRLDAKDAPKDQAALLLNHKVHLDPELRGPEGPEPLKCLSCHHPDEQGAYMKPIHFEKDCMRCHQLDFDDRLPGKTVSHMKQPQEVRAELQAAYYELVSRELGRPAFTRRQPGAPKSKEEVSVEEMTAKVEKFLYAKKSKKCLLCHVVEDSMRPTSEPSGDVLASEAGLPRIKKTDVPSAWFIYSRFDHAPHLGLPDIKKKDCVACHEGAPKSIATSDVLLPGIKNCQACHFEPNGAQASCNSCHYYHDKTLQRPGELPPQLRDIPKHDQARASMSSSAGGGG